MEKGGRGRKEGEARAQGCGPIMEDAAVMVIGSQRKLPEFTNSVGESKDMEYVGWYDDI